MRGRVIAAALLVAVGLVWIGQGLGLLRGSGFMVGDLRWAVSRARRGRRRRRPRDQRLAVAPAPGLSQAAQVASAGPAVTVVAVADERQPDQAAVAGQPLDDLGIAHRQVAEPRVAERPRGLVEQRPRAEPLDEAPQLGRAPSVASCRST